MRLLLLGCTGFVGRELMPQLLAAGHTLTVVSRQQRQLAGVSSVQADPSRPESWAAGSALQQALEQAEGVVNLAGEPIAEQRWTPAHLELLHRSRIDTTRHLVAAINASPTPPQVLVSASAVGFYGTSETASFNEDSPAGTDVLASENIEEVVPMPADLTGDGELFMLRVRGESMIDIGIFDGDFVVCQSQTTATKGDIVIAGIPGEEATVKTYQERDGKIVLVPHNASLNDMVFDPAEVQIFGKVVTVMRRY